MQSSIGPNFLVAVMFMFVADGWLALSVLSRGSLDAITVERIIWLDDGFLGHTTRLPLVYTVLVGVRVLSSDCVVVWLAICWWRQPTIMTTCDRKRFRTYSGQCSNSVALQLGRLLKPFLLSEQDRACYIGIDFVEHFWATETCVSSADIRVTATKKRGHRLTTRVMVRSWLARCDWSHDGPTTKSGRLLLLWGCLVSGWIPMSFERHLQLRCNDGCAVSSRQLMLPQRMMISGAFSGLNCSVSSWHSSGR